MSMICSHCKNEVGCLEYVEDKPYCKECIKVVWDIRSSQVYYKELFLDCPFCKTQIDITKDCPEDCPSCGIKIRKPGFCQFCEDSHRFIKKHDAILGVDEK